ncbi:MAG: family 43 glycosylhydrolase [Lachnospiraceae bacterium]|nr:family 43 glycosylhydrolase [Lachnospiraceae bacterium]
MTEFEQLTMTQSYKGLTDTNPLITQRFGADPYALVYEDRVYIYMTADIFEYNAAGNPKENTYGLIKKINVISTDDMVNFTDHGSINAAGPLGSAKWARNSWAPAAAWKEIDGKPQFFLYFADAGGGIGVLQADSPVGPFHDPLGEALISRNTPNCADVLWLFDPAVLMDDDGRAYIYFGGGVPEGQVANPGTARVAELGEDMVSIVGEPRTIDVPYLFEDSGIHKAGDKYYYTYCTNWQVDEAGTEKYGFYNAEIASMVSDSPMGPFEFKEVILKNPGSVFGLYGNNHHCVFNFRGDWYITYHTRVLEQNMGIEKGYRSTHIDKFTMEEDGTIGIIQQTLTGREQLKYVDAYAENRAVNFAVMGGVDTVAADSVANEYGSGDMALGDIQSGDFIKIAGVDFGSTIPSSFSATVRNATDIQAEGIIRISIDSLDGEVLGYLPISDVPAGDNFTELTAQLTGKADGVHDLFFVFSGEGYEIESWKFVK